MVSQKSVKKQQISGRTVRSALVYMYVYACRQAFMNRIKTSSTAFPGFSGDLCGHPHAQLMSRYVTGDGVMLQEMATAALECCCICKPKQPAQSWNRSLNSV